jgi:hypothetical protein
MCLFAANRETKQYLSLNKTSTDIEKGSASERFYLVHVWYKVLEFPHSFTNSSSSHLHIIHIYKDIKN